MGTIKNNGFLEKFGWVRCLRCMKSFSDAASMLVLTCRHTFCVNCFQKGCQLVDIHRKIAVCFACKKQAKCAQFNGNLPAKFLKPFEKIGDSAMMRAAELQEEHSRRNMLSLSKKLRNKLKIMKEKKAVSQRKHAATLKMRQQHDELYEQMLKHYKPDEIERLLSYSLDDLKKMDLSPESESESDESDEPGNPVFSPLYLPSSSSSSSSVKARIVDGDSPTSLYRHVLVKNATSSSSSNTRTHTSCGDLSRFDGATFDDLPKKIQVPNVSQARVQLPHPIFNQNIQKHQSQQRKPVSQPKFAGGYKNDDGRSGGERVNRAFDAFNAYSKYKSL